MVASLSAEPYGIHYSCSLSDPELFRDPVLIGKLEGNVAVSVPSTAK